MATTTPVNGWTIPEDTDAANIETAVQTPLLQVDQRVIPIFATVAARATALAAPVAGQHCYVTATGESYLYNGTAWVSATARTIVKASSTARVNNTVLDDPHLLCAVEANSSYIARIVLGYTQGTNVGSEFQHNWTFPAGTGGLIRSVRAMASGQTNRAAATSNWGDYGMGTAIIAGNAVSSAQVLVSDLSFTTAGVAGTLTLQWAQAVTNASATTLRVGSFIQIWKVA